MKMQSIVVATFLKPRPLHAHAGTEAAADSLKAWLSRLDYPSCCIAVLPCVVLPWIPYSSECDDGGWVTFQTKPKIRSLACRPDPPPNPPAPVILAFCFPWLPMHDASFLSFLPISWHCCCVELKLSSLSPSLCRSSPPNLSIMHACLALLASSDPVLFTLLVAVPASAWLEINCFGFWVFTWGLFLSLLENKTGLSDS